MKGFDSDDGNCHPDRCKAMTGVTKRLPWSGWRFHIVQLHRQFPAIYDYVSGRYSITVSIETKVDVDSTCGSAEICSASSTL